MASTSLVLCGRLRSAYSEVRPFSLYFTIGRIPVNKTEDHEQANLTWHYVKLNAEVKFDMPVAGGSGKKESKTFAEDAYPISV